MNPPCRPRLIGLETEYGCLVQEGQLVHRIIQRIRDWIFENAGYGLIDLHHRDWDEPPGNGGFLFNGGRAYEDMGHLEVCTPECARYRDVVLYDRVNDLIVEQALAALGLEDSVSIIRNNIDHYTGATFGCHENYLIKREAPLRDESIFSLLTFLTLRGLYTGAGRVGGLEDQRYRSAHKSQHAILRYYRGFQVTQRADYVENDFFRWVQGNRAIINTRDEPLSDPNEYRRLHLLHGDTNVLPAAAFLKVGSTSLVLDLLEMDLMPRLRLDDPVGTLKRISYRPEGPWDVRLHDGTRTQATEVLDAYREAAEKAFAGRNEETDQLLALWKRVIGYLRLEDTSPLIGLIDWVTKKYILEAFCEAEALSFTDSWLEAQDLEYHNILKSRNLGLPMAQSGYWLSDPDKIAKCLTTPPMGSRAATRSRLMKQIDREKHEYVIDWDGLRWGNQFASLLDPYTTDPQIRFVGADFKDWAKDPLD